MKLVLIRHGESIGNLNQVIYGRTDYELTQKGVEQSEAVRQQLSNENLLTIYSSPLKRALHLAQLIAQDHGVQVHIDKRISEMNYGLFEGLTPQEVEIQYGESYQNYLNHYETYIIPEGEGYFEFRERVYDFLQMLLTKEGTFIIVTHSGVIRECLIYLLALNPEQVWHFKIEPACTIHISYNKGYGVLEQMRMCSY